MEKLVVPEGVSILKHVSYIFCYVCVKYVCAGAASVVIQALSTMFCFSFKILIKNVFWDRVSLCLPDFSGIHCVYQVGFELMEYRDLPASIS